MPEAPISEAYVALALLLGLAAVAGRAAERLGLAYAVGYVAAGIAAGKAVGGALAGGLSLLADVGVALLAFEIGREVGVAGLRRLGALSALVALGELLVAGTIVVPVGLVAGLPRGELFVLALAPAFYSTAIGLKLMEQRSLEGDAKSALLSVAAAEDVIALVALAALPQLALGGLTTREVLEQASVLLVLSVAVVVVGVYALARFFNLLVKPDEAGVALAISVGLAYGLLARYAGLSPVLGAFAAGLAFSEHPHASKVGESMKPIRELLLIVFS